MSGQLIRNKWVKSLNPDAITRFVLLRLPGQIVLSVIILLLLSGPAVADSGQVFDTFTLHYENDFLLGTDRDYTSGLKLTWSTPYSSDVSAEGWPGWVYPLLARLPLLNDPVQQRAVSLSFGQEIYTPVEIRRTELLVDDRPYAGRTYFAVGFHGKTACRQHTWEFNLGLLGPESLAAESQALIHKMTGSTEPQGWDHQLGNEITVDTAFETQWKLRPPGFHQKFSYDFISHLGGRIGTVNIYANGGGEFRFGWDLPDDFGACPIRAGCQTNSAFKKTTADYGRRKKFSALFFLATDGRVVLRDIYLDGNTFRDSHAVDKKLFVADLIAGISVHYGKVQTTYSYVYRTKQVETQDRAQAFSSLSLSWMF